ncbi:MAG: UDP-N-acetylmuramate dehydrogenase [Synechococcaceae cyanobacterium RL_1_2]|nr:UDP-N-acetylmuramate dehydrogenase [Synechococcaceae cyanobacterium RL_1_2]
MMLTSKLPSLRTKTTLTVPQTDCLVQADVPLSSFTSFRVGGKAQWYGAPKYQDDLNALVAWGQEQGLPLTMLGAGSNLLVSDRGVDGLVISTRHLRNATFQDEEAIVTASAGEPIARLAWKLAKKGWSGMEWAVGIPGTVGGAVVMNAGAHQSCLADCLVNVVVLNANGTLERLTPAELEFSYRTCNLQGNRDRIVLQATFQLQPGFNPQTIHATTLNNLNQRKSSQPYDKPSCGSVFRNPGSHAAGWLIEQLGLKGYQIGGAQVAHRHANFILNCGNAKAQDIFELICFVQDKVKSHWALELETEVRMLGNF